MKLVISLALLAEMEAAFGAPVIRPRSVVNAASNLPAALPNGGIAQGGMFIVKGQGLGARGTAVANSFPLRTEMGGTSIRITVAGTAVDALLIYVVAGQASDPEGPFDQLAGIAPSATPTGDGTVTVTFQGQTSTPAPIRIVPNAFGIFTVNEAGAGPGVFTDAEYRVNNLVSAPHAGDLLFLWGTGLGAIPGSDSEAPPVGNLDVPVQVYVGNVPAAVSYKGRSGCCAGIDQILFRVPPGVQGCYVSVLVRAGNQVSNSVTMSIAASGNVCSDPTGFAPEELSNAQNGMTIAEIGLMRVAGTFSVPGMGTLQGAVDFGEGHIRKFPPYAVFGAARGSVATFEGVPSAGCIAYPFVADDELFGNIDKGIDDPVPQQQLDAGPSLTIRGPAGVREIPREGSAETGFRYDPTDESLGGGFPPLFPQRPDFLVPGAFRVDNGSGSSAVGPFTASLTIPSSPLLWTNQAALTTISRSQDLTITWTGGASGLVMIDGSSANPATKAGAGFHCSAPAAAGTFTIPSWVLSALPASGMASDIAAPVGFLMIGETLTSPARFRAQGLDAGHFSWILRQAKNVNFQ